MAQRLVGRSRELGLLRTALDRPEGGLITLSGLPGVGKTSLVLGGAAELPHVYHRVPPLPGPEQLVALSDAMGRGEGGWRVAAPDDDVPRPPGRPTSLPDEAWSRLFARAAAAVPEGRGAVLILDDAHRLDLPRGRLAAALSSALREARARGRALHVVVVAPTELLGTRDDEAELRPEAVRVAPLGFRAAAPLLPGAGAADRLEAYALFGGLPRHLALVDKGLSLARNLRRLVLRRDAPLGDAGIDLLERTAQAPARYAAILTALSGGESDWAGVHAGVTDLTASGQVAPYLKRLEETGLVEVRRSLDASPRSRSRRYRIADPFFAFWFRFILPHREAMGAGRGADAVLAHLREARSAHVGSVFPEVCRQYMRHDAIESVGANARECGSLWGAGYDIPVAGILASGAAFYGRPAAWRKGDPSPLAQLDTDIRETRYGFGRERRLRVLFPRGDAPPALIREAARRHDVTLVDVRALAGEG